MEGVWNFTRMDEVVVPFLEATLLPNTSTKIILDIETSPQWMWEDAGTCVPLPHGPRDPSCPGGGGNRTCADATGASLPPGDRTRCPHWGDTRVPRDPSWREMAAYFARVALWYTRGGFIDERGVQHKGAFMFDVHEYLSPLTQCKIDSCSFSAI